jgi:hypothetical protein
MERMEKQSAVEWLVKQLRINGVILVSSDYEIIEQAKEMEKQEQQKLAIILAAFAEEIGDKKIVELLIESKQYYKETFKTE